MPARRYAQLMADVVIVGAGVAGISAATVLDTAGGDVILVDKANRAGGRCATRCVNADDDRRWFDYGAQYFTARDPVFRTVVDTDLAAGQLQRWRPAIRVAEHDGRGWRHRASPDDRERLIGADGVNGWLQQRLASTHAKLRCDTPVRALRPTNTGWRLTLAGTKTPLHAGAVILTPPAAQSAALLGRAAAEISVLAMSGSALHACHALVVEAPAMADCHGVFVANGTLSWFADNSHKAGQADAARRLWTLHATPEYSDTHLAADADSVTATLVREFVAITGFAQPKVRTVHAHRWRYARPDDAAPAPDAGCWVDRRRRLALAGDWLAGGRVEGAWLSGRAAALGLLA